MLIFLDMDGVIVDFMNGCIERHNREPPPEHEWHKYDYIDKHWQISKAEFWQPLMGHDFWAELNWMPDGKQILHMIESVYPKESIFLLTAPNTRDSFSYSGKHAWIQKNMPEYEDRMIPCKHKYLLSQSSPTRILIDDMKENIDKWGGPKLLLPRPWNKNNGLDPVNELEKFLNAL